MSPGRPATTDDPGKYAEAFDLFLLTRKGGAEDQSAAEEIGDFLVWAVTTGQAGFGIDDVIVVGSLAEGVGRSRNTAAAAVGRLVAAGMAVQDKPKSPYRIISEHPLFPDAGRVADEQISLTIKLESTSYFSDVADLESGSKLAGFLSDELAGSGDILIREAAPTWSADRIQTYHRLRAISEDGRPSAYLAETTFVRLPAESAPGFRDRMARLQQAGVHQISMYTVLGQCGLTDLRAGRTQVTVGAPPRWLGPALGRIEGSDGIDHATFAGDQPLLKWTYALFRPDVEPMVTFSVCYVRTDMLGVFIRSLDVEALP